MLDNVVGLECDCDYTVQGPGHPQLGPDPGPGGSGQGRVRADPGPLIFSSELIFFFKCSNFNIFVDFYVLSNSSVNSYLFMMK